MNRKAIQVFVAFAILVGISASLLARARSNYVLGAPGVKVANTPIYSVIDGVTNVASPISIPLPDAVPGYTSVLLNVDPIELQMLPPDTVFGRRGYRARDGFETMISVVLMGTDRTSIHKPQYCLTGQGHSIIKSEVVTIPIKRPHPYDLRAMKLTTSTTLRQHDGQMREVRGLYVYWFVADGQLTPHHEERMWLMGRDLITKGLLQRWAYVAYWSLCYPGQEDAIYERMKDLMLQTIPDFQTTTGSQPPASLTLN